MSHLSGFYHLDVCAGSVLTPHGHITNVQKILGSRRYTGIGERRLCGSFLDAQLEHAETCGTAEATPRHHACVHAVPGGLRLADPGITTEPRGLTETQSRPADVFTAAAGCPRTQCGSGRVCGILQCSSSEETQRKLPLIEKPHTLQERNPRPTS